MPFLLGFELYFIFISLLFKNLRILLSMIAKSTQTQIHYPICLAVMVRNSDIKQKQYMAILY